MKFSFKEVIKSIISPRYIFSIKRLLRSYLHLNYLPRKRLRFEVHLADHCNLRCRHCDHFSPLALPHFLDLEGFTSDCSRLSSLTDGVIERLYLLGGEPLLHPDLLTIFPIARRHFPIGTIALITNGLLLSRQPTSFWQSCHTNRIDVIISDYPVQKDLSTSEHQAQIHEVSLRIWRKGSQGMYRTPLDLIGSQSMRGNFRRCFRANDCIFLQDGRLYTCAVVPCIKHFNAHFGTDLPNLPSDSIDIYSVSSLQSLMQFLSRPIPFCKYCNLKSIQTGLQWGLSKRNINEWT